MMTPPRFIPLYEGESVLLRLVVTPEGCALQQLRPQAYGESRTIELSLPARHALYVALGEYLGTAPVPRQALPEIPGVDRPLARIAHTFSSPEPSLQTILQVGLRHWEVTHPGESRDDFPEVEAELRMALLAHHWPADWSYADHASDVRRTLPAWFPDEEV